jgi:cell wall-associated NlpC family hydrolase
MRTKTVAEVQVINMKDGRVLALLASIGVPYHYGRGDLKSAAWPPGPCDCSGFAQQALAAIGILRRDAWDDITADGLRMQCDKIEEKDAAIGDLVFYGMNGKASHVTVCIGAGQTIGANGGKPSTLGDDRAACVQVRPIRYRADYMHVGRLKARARAT